MLPQAKCDTVDWIAWKKKVNIIMLPQAKCITVDWLQERKWNFAV